MGVMTTKESNKNATKYRKARIAIEKAEKFANGQKWVMAHIFFGGIILESYTASKVSKFFDLEKRTFNSSEKLSMYLCDHAMEVRGDSPLTVKKARAYLS